MATSSVVRRPLRQGEAPAEGGFWSVRVRTSSKTLHLNYDQLVERVLNASSVDLYNAVEAGVPTYLVTVIARATGQGTSDVIEMIGLPPTTFRRKDEAKEPLPDVAGHRVVGFLRIAAMLRQLLKESGDPERLQDFDLDSWMAQWIHERLPELGDKTPAEMLRNPDGLRAVEQVVERMRGGLPA